MPHSYPRQDQETGVVAQKAQMALALRIAPADESVAWMTPPGRRAKQQTSQRTALACADQIFKVLADTIAMPQIMVALEQPLEQAALRTAGGDRFHAQGPQCVQLGVQSGNIVRKFRPTAIASPIDRSPLSGWQPDQPSGLQFEQQRATGHVLEPPRLVAPRPKVTQLAGQSRPMPRRMVQEQSPDLCQVLGTQVTSLDERFGQHPGLG
jgi:hypothetical protein